MTETTTASVQSLTAEVRVLMVGSRQVTAGVYNQLDYVRPENMTPFGRVRVAKDPSPKTIELVGVDGNGNLVSSWARPPSWIIHDSDQGAYNHLMTHEYPEENSRTGLNHRFRNFGRYSIDWKWFFHDCNVGVDLRWPMPSKCPDCFENDDRDLAKAQRADHLVGKHCNIRSLRTHVNEIITAKYSVMEEEQRRYDAFAELPLIVLASMR